MLLTSPIADNSVNISPQSPLFVTAQHPIANSLHSVDRSIVCITKQVALYKIWELSVRARAAWCRNDVQALTGQLRIPHSTCNDALRAIYILNMPWPSLILNTQAERNQMLLARCAKCHTHNDYKQVIYTKQTSHAAIDRPYIPADSCRHRPAAYIPAWKLDTDRPYRYRLIDSWTSITKI